MVGGENGGQCWMEKQNGLKKMWSGINPRNVRWSLWAVHYSTERVINGKALTTTEETFFGCNLWRWFGTTVLLHGLSFVTFVSACNLASVRRIFSRSTSREMSCLPPYVRTRADFWPGNKARSSMLLQKDTRHCSEIRGPHRREYQGQVVWASGLTLNMKAPEYLSSRPSPLSCIQS